MAETSGFFEAILDEFTGEYDLEYFASQFAAFFALFIGNGVFGSPTNQLKVSAGDALTVKISPGHSFINGYWYENDEELTLSITPNLTSSSRADAIICRWDNSLRRISTIVQDGSTEIIRNDSYYDLKLANVLVPAGAVSISESNIVDTRTDENVCGLVTQLLKVQTTADLFAQYNSLFWDWFNNIKDQVSEDMAIQIQQEIGDLEQEIGDLEGLNTSSKDSLVAAINEIEEESDELFTHITNIIEGTTTVGAANQLSPGHKINGVLFNGTEDITVVDATKPNIIYATVEPTEVPEGTIIFVYEE